MYYLGSMTGLAAGAVNNVATGPSGIGRFDIPPGTKALMLVPSASGVLFEMSQATGISFLTSAARGAQLTGPGVINGPFRAALTQNPTVVSIFNPTAAVVSCRVYAVPNQ